MVDLVACGLLRRHVGHGAQRRQGLGQGRSPLNLSQAEVHDLRLTFARDHDVAALDVPVDDALPVGFLQAGGNLGHNGRNVLGPQGPRSDLLLERLSLHIFHGDEGLAFGLTHLMDDADVRMG